MSNSLAAFGGGVAFTPALNKKPKNDLDRGYVPRLELVATGNSKQVLEDKAKTGEFIIVDGQEVTQLGKEVTVVLLGKIYKAVDRSGDEVIVNFDPESEIYQDIEAREKESGFDSGCMHGPLYLAYNIETERFIEFYLCSASAKREEDRLDSYIPIGEALAQQLGTKPRPAQLTTLQSRLVEGKKYKWFVFDTKPGPKSLNGIDPPPQELVVKACTNFYKQTQPEQVEEESRSR